MSYESSLKIFVVSLAEAKKFKAYAAYNGEQLAILSVSLISGQLFSVWKTELAAEIQERKKQGYVTLVEDSGESLSIYGTQCLLDEVDGSDRNRTRLQSALLGYFSLQRAGRLQIAPECQKYVIQDAAEGGWIERKNDDKGRPFYSVQWQKFSSAHRCILLCVTAVIAEPLSERFLSAMAMSGEEDSFPEQHPAKRMEKALSRFYGGWHGNQKT